MKKRLSHEDESACACFCTGRDVFPLVYSYIIIKFKKVKNNICETRNNIVFNLRSITIATW